MNEQADNLSHNYPHTLEFIKDVQTRLAAIVPFESEAYEKVLHLILSLPRTEAPYALRCVESTLRKEPSIEELTEQLRAMQDHIGEPASADGFLQLHAHERREQRREWNLERKRNRRLGKL